MPKNMYNLNLVRDPYLLIQELHYNVCIAEQTQFNFGISV